MAARSNAVGVVCTSCGEVARVEAAVLERSGAFRCARCGAERAIGPVPRRAEGAEAWSPPVFGENYAPKPAPRQQLHK